MIQTICDKCKVVQNNSNIATIAMRFNNNASYLLHIHICQPCQLELFDKEIYNVRYGEPDLGEKIVEVFADVISDAVEHHLANR